MIPARRGIPVGVSLGVPRGGITMWALVKGGTAAPMKGWAVSPSVPAAHVRELDMREPSLADMRVGR
jgi:hypothetical protein